MLPGPCASIVISQVKWGCGVPRTEAIHMEYCASLGLLFRRALSAAEFTLKRVGIVEDQLSLPHKAWWQPSPVQLLPVWRGWCCEPWLAAGSPSEAPLPEWGDRGGQACAAASQGALPLLGICWKPEKARGEGFLPAPNWCSGGRRATRNHLWLP